MSSFTQQQSTSFSVAPRGRDVFEWNVINDNLSAESISDICSSDSSDPSDSCNSSDSSDRIVIFEGPVENSNHTPDDSTQNFLALESIGSVSSHSSFSSDVLCRSSPTIEPLDAPINLLISDGYTPTGRSMDDIDKASLGCSESFPEEDINGDSPEAVGMNSLVVEKDLLDRLMKMAEELNRSHAGAKLLMVQDDKVFPLIDVAKNSKPEFLDSSCLKDEEDTFEETEESQQDWVQVSIAVVAGSLFVSFARKKLLFGGFGILGAVIGGCYGVYHCYKLMKSSKRRD